VFDEADILLTEFDTDVRRIWALLALQTLQDASMHGGWCFLWQNIYMLCKVVTSL
jgi:hypothetical protein